MESGFDGRWVSLIGLSWYWLAGTFGVIADDFEVILLVVFCLLMFVFETNHRRSVSGFGYRSDTGFNVSMLAA